MTEKERRLGRLQGVYLITDHGDRLVERVRDAVSHVCAVQFRSKEHTPDDKRRLGTALSDLCRDAGVLFIVNDDLSLARELAADGVHLGQDDGDPAVARRLLGPDAIIGVSTHDLAEARAAQAAGADYIGFGAMYPSASKEITHLAGPALLAHVRPHVNIPVIAIGGINRDNAAPLIDAGADCLAVIAAVMADPAPGVAAGELQLIFNRRRDMPRGSVLSVAGSDSGGGAGVQADLKTITLLGVYGASVITALTAQNTLGVNAILDTPAGFVGAQLDAVLTDILIDVVKTGMLFSAGIIKVVAEKLDAYDQRLVVVDPVMIAQGGASLVNGEAVALLKEIILPRAYLLTPNVPEAEALTGLTIDSEPRMEKAALALHGMGVRNVLLKGGHLAGPTAVDIFFDGRELRRYAAPRLASANTHGTGCTLASAIAAFLARGEPLPIAIDRAKEFITEAIRLARPLGKGHGPVNHFAAARELTSKEH